MAKSSSGDPQQGYVPWKLPPLGEGAGREPGAPARSPVFSAITPPAVLTETFERRVAEAAAAAAAEGRERGLAEGRAEAQREAAQLGARYSALLAALQRELAELDGTLEQALTEMVIDAASAALRVELELRPEQVRAVVLEAVRELPPLEGEKRLRVHPDDVPLLEPALEADIVIEADASVSRGGCRLVCGPCEVDATLESRVERMARALRGAPSDDD